MNDMISKSEVISAIESLISHYEWRLHDNSLSQEDFMVIISGKLNVLKEVLISIKKIRPLNLASKSTWISCDDRLPETDDYYLVYGTEYDFFSGEKIPYYGMLQYSLKYKAWNTKAPVIITHWQSLPEPPKGE